MLRTGRHERDGSANVKVHHVSCYEHPIRGARRNMLEFALRIGTHSWRNGNLQYSDRRSLLQAPHEAAGVICNVS